MTPPLSPSLERHPNLEEWITIGADGIVTVRTGKVELGQGLVTAIARIAADELDVSIDRIAVLTADTAATPNELVTAGSWSMVHSGSAVRQAAAEARRRLLASAAARLGTPCSGLTVSDGVVHGDGARSTSYRDLLPETDLTGPVGLAARPKAPGELRLVGKPGGRTDLPGLVAGTTRFLNDLVLPGMLHARVARPERPGARLVELEREAVESLPGVIALIRDGSFLAVVAEREEQAVRARERLLSSARWEGGDDPPHGSSAEWLLGQPATSFRLVDGVPSEKPNELPPPSDQAAITVQASFSRPYLLHGSIGPSAAAACWADGELTVWTSSQGVFPLREALASILDHDPGKIRVRHVVGSGSYGHNGADDAALDAALAARAVPGRPVLLKWMRDDEHLWEPFGPAAIVTTRASIDPDGRLVEWATHSRSQTHSVRPGAAPTASELLAARYLADPAPFDLTPPSLSAQGGIHRNADPLYEVPTRHIVKHHIGNPAPRTSALRSLGTFVNVFALESTMDEIAAAGGRDPLAFRLTHLADPRAREVLAAAAERSGWPGSTDASGRGLGLAFARYKNSQCYVAAAVELTVDDATAAITLERIVIAADAGRIVDPDGLRNQLEGGALQSASWTLFERVTFDDRSSTSRDWDSYPVMRFTDVPEVETILIDRPDADWLGAGEGSQGPTAAAIANAVFRATGLRVRDLPVTPERLRAAAETGAY